MIAKRRKNKTVTLFSFCTCLICLSLFVTDANADSQYLNSTLIIDEIPGRLQGDEDFPPGRLVHYAENGEVIFETNMLKMPYDAVRMLSLIHI